MYLAMKANDDEVLFSECLRDLQPPEMAYWEREREKMEFDRASNLYKPMTSILSNRFVSANSHDISNSGSLF